MMSAQQGRTTTSEELPRKYTFGDYLFGFFRSGKPPENRPKWWMQLLAILLVIPRGLTNGIPTACSMLVFGQRVGIPFGVSIFLAVFFGLFGFYGPFARVQFTVSHGIHAAHESRANKPFSLWDYFMCLAGFRPWPHEVIGDYEEFKKLSFWKRMYVRLGIAWAILMPFLDSFIAFVSVFLFFSVTTAFTGSTFGLPIFVPIVIGIILATFTLYCQWHELPRAALKDFTLKKDFSVAFLFHKKKPDPSDEIDTAYDNNPQPAPKLNNHFWAKVGSHTIALLLSTIRGIGNAIPTACAMLSFAGLFGNPFGALGISLAVIFGVVALYVPLLRTRAKTQNAFFKAFTKEENLGFLGNLILATALKIADKYLPFPEDMKYRRYFARGVAILIPFVEAFINFVSIFLLASTLTGLSGGTLVFPIGIIVAVGLLFAIPTFITSWFDMSATVMTNFGFSPDDTVRKPREVPKETATAMASNEKAVEIVTPKLQKPSKNANETIDNAAIDSDPAAERHQSVRFTGEKNTTNQRRQDSEESNSPNASLLSNTPKTTGCFGTFLRM